MHTHSAPLCRGRLLSLLYGLSHKVCAVGPASVINGFPVCVFVLLDLSREAWCVSFSSQTWFTTIYLLL